VRANHGRIGLGLIAPIGNKGELRWMVLDGATKASVLIRDAQRKVFRVLYRLQVHRAVVVREWLAKYWTKIEVSYLLSYSPELNPDDELNGYLSTLPIADL
jgi:hypothetical protein